MSLVGKSPRGDAIKGEKERERERERKRKRDEGGSSTKIDIMETFDSVSQDSTACGQIILFWL